MDHQMVPALPNSQGAGELVHSVRQLQLRQDRINQSLAQASKVNMLMNVANYMRGRKLMSELALGKATLLELGERSENQGAELGRVSTTLEHQSAELMNLESSVRARHDEVSVVLEQMEGRLANQRRLIAEQHEQIDRLRSSKLRQDLVVDGGIVILSGMLTSTLNWPLWALTRTLSLLPIGLRRTRRLWLAQTLRMVAFVAIARSARVYAMRHGLHSSIGSAESYSQVLWVTLFEAARHRAALLTSGDENSPRPFQSAEMSGGE